MASLIGRFFRNITLFLALFALVAPAIVPNPAHAAPFAAIIMDARTGEELWSQNADTKLHPASLTKMMTLYITFQEIQSGRMSLDTVVTVSKHAAAQPPSRLGLKPGQKIKVRYLIRAAAIKSANDAAAALGDHIGGSEAAFASRMTRTARALGMKNSTFKNAHGLTAPGHLSTARDMTLLGRHLFYDFPQFYNIFSRRTADAGVAKVVNTNSRFLDGYEGADGIKTGYTVPAGFNLTASAKRGDKRIIATVFGGTSTAQRNAKMVDLMNKGFAMAKSGVRESRPAAAAVQGQDLLADAAPESPAGIDTPDAPGGAAKTVRVSGAVTSSPRPKPRPDRAAVAEALLAEATPPVPDALAAAIAEGVETAIAEATAGTGGKRPVDLAVNYDLGKLQLGAGYTKADQDNQFAVRASYGMGPFTLAAYAQRDEINDASRNVFRVAGMYTLGASEFHVNVGYAGKRGDLADTQATQATLGYNYNLSKRTKVYGFVTKVDNKAAAEYMTKKAGVDFSSVAVGVRHNF